MTTAQRSRRRVHLPAWSAWPAGSPAGELTIGIEEELMLLDPRDWSLAFRADEVVAELPEELRGRVTLETHASVLEISTTVHRRVADAVAELAQMRAALAHALERLGLRAAVAGMHPSAQPEESVVTSHPRYRDIGASMRVLARREPTMATHVHVGVATPEAAVRLLNRLRAHVPLLLALAANSPFWRGRPTGFASNRTILFDAFPRSGMPRAFKDYAEWARVVDALVTSRALGDPTHIWWDVRLQPRYGTVEVRSMDAQTSLEDVAALVSLVQALARLELERPDDPPLPAIELIQENRFLAARDGMDALLIDLDGRGRVPAIERLERVLEACAPHAERLGSGPELASLRRLAARTGAARQLARGQHRGLRDVAAALARAYAPEGRPPRARAAQAAA
jgi:glutamate---cysteine ligase / carboxylate-amine ligase